MIILHPSVRFAAQIGYFPQIKKLIGVQASTAGISLNSWYIWSLSAIITCCYSAFVVKDMSLSIVTGISMILVVTTTLLILRVHFIEKKAEALAIAEA